MTTTNTGDRGGWTWTEQWRMECEARHVTNMPTLKDRRGYLERIGIKRGQAARKQLEQEILRQWKK